MRSVYPGAHDSGVGRPSRPPDFPPWRRPPLPARHTWRRMDRGACRRRAPALDNH